MSNLVAQNQNLVTIESTLKSPDIYSKIQEMLNRKPDTYITSVMQAIESNNMLMSCSPESITGAVISSCSMNLPLNNNLGFAYLVPFKSNKKCKENNWKDDWRTEAQLQIGYKGFIQLAQRTGQIRSINAIAVFDTDSNESVLNRLTSLIPEDVDGKIIGYIARLETITGFVAYEKMTMKAIESHAYDYSQTYKSAKDKNQTYSVWHKNLDAMSKKTVIKKIMKYCPMSVELQKAMESDQGVINQDGGISYPDNEIKDVVQAKQALTDSQVEKAIIKIKSGKSTLENLDSLYTLTDEQYSHIQHQTSLSGDSNE